MHFTIGQSSLLLAQTSAFDFFKSKGQFNFLCALCNRDTPIHKSLIIYDKFITMRKHLYNYICQLRIHDSLNSDDDRCQDFNIFKDTSSSSKLEECKKNTKPFDGNGQMNIKFYAIYRIMNKNFAPYLEFINP